MGRALLSELAGDAAYASVVSLARRPGPSFAKVETRVVDMDGLAVPACDVAFSCLGTTIKKAGSQEAFRAVDHDLVLRFARAALAAGARSFHVVSAMGASASSRVFYNRVKGEMERDVAAVGFESACAYRPSLLAGERDERRMAERAGLALAQAFALVIPRRYQAIPASTVARAMARHARSPGHAGFAAHESDELWRLASPEMRG